MRTLGSRGRRRRNGREDPREGRRLPKPRVLLADDHGLLLEAFTRLLEPEVAVVGRATDGRALVRAALELRPDIVVADISMPELIPMVLLVSPSHRAPEGRTGNAQ